MDRVNHILITTWNGMAQALLFLLLAVISIQLESIKALLKARLTTKQREAAGVKQVPYTDIVSVLKALIGLK